MSKGISRLKRLDKRAVSLVVSAVIMTGAAIALGFAVLAWSQSRSSGYIKEYGEATDAEMARLKERLTVEHIHYNRTSGNITIYLLNCGAIDVKIQSVHVRNSTWYKTFSSLSLELDMGEEGYVVLPNPPLPTLKEGDYYYVRVVTERGSLFDSGFVA